MSLKAVGVPQHGGLRYGGLSIQRISKEKGLFVHFLDFQVLLGASREGRKRQNERPISADLQKGRTDTPSAPICYIPTCCVMLRFPAVSKKKLGEVRSSYVPAGGLFFGTEKTMDSHRRDGILRFFLRLEIGQFSPHFGASSLLNCTVNLEKREKSTGENSKRSSGDGAPKLKISVPCAWSNVS